MSVRIHTLAKELGVPSKDLVAVCKDAGLEIKSHMSSITDQEVLKVRKLIETKDKKKTAAKKKVAKAKPKETTKKPKAKEEAPEPKEVKKRPAKKEKVAEPVKETKAPEVKEKVGEQRKVVTRPPRKKSFAPIRKTTTPVPKRPEAPRTQAGAPPRRRARPVRSHPSRSSAPPRPAKAPARKPGIPTSVELEPPISIKLLSATIGIKANQIMRRLMESGIMATINQTIDPEVAKTVGLELGCEVKIKEPKSLEAELVTEEKDRPEELKPRAPIVTFLGHVDHGKTSLLDAIRQTNVFAGESGGITQHIGAYRVDDGDRHVCFLDTPGHEAFTAMRARGANVTDVVVLVVAADDGVMPQTEEAIDHARAAGVPIVVAINKIDVPNANPDRVKQQLSGHDLVPEEWGGNTICVEVSAITKEGLDDLVEMLSLEAELLELRANPNKKGRGTVLEAEIDTGKGVAAKILVEDGTLRCKDIILCGSAYGKIRSMFNDQGRSILEAPPAFPVLVTGFSGVPEVGDKFFVVDDIQKSREIAERKKLQLRQAALTAERQHVTMENLFSHIAEGRLKEVRIVLKADVKGSVEVLKKSLSELPSDEVRTTVIHSGVGGINTSDILLADASDAIVLGFHVVADERARALAEEKRVDIKLYRVIYEIIADMRAALEGLLEPKRVEVSTGRIIIKEVYKASRHGNIAGCQVTEGLINRRNHIRVIRDNVVIHEGTIDSLRRFKDDVREVRDGFECGLKIAGYDDIKKDDIVEAYEIQEIARKLEA